MYLCMCESVCVQCKSASVIDVSLCVCESVCVQDIIFEIFLYLCECIPVAAFRYLL